MTTDLPAVRRTVRVRARLAGHLVLAAFIIAVALTYKFASDGLLVLTVVVAGLVGAQFLPHWWVRRTDRRLAAVLSRRVTHPARLGWREVLGVPRAAVAAVAFVGTVALAGYALSSADSSARYAGAVLLIGSCGVAVAMLVQLRHALTHPVVADDESALAADLALRAEDARDAMTPTILWALPASTVLGTTAGWSTGAWMVFIVLNAAALTVVNLGIHCGRLSGAKVTR